MLVLLILHIIKKSNWETTTVRCFLDAFSKAKYLLPLLLLSTSSPYEPIKPRSKVNFSIFIKNKNIGYLEITKTNSGDSLIYDINSEIRTKLLKKIKINGKEKVIYKNDYRKTNISS